MWFKNLNDLDRMYEESLHSAAVPLHNLLEATAVAPVKWVSYGQYVQFNQLGIDWAVFMQGIQDMGYNACSFHVNGGWGNSPGMRPWLFDPTTKLFDLSRPNPKYKEHIYTFLDEAAKRGIKVEICLADSYYLSKWLKYGADKLHPYRNNKQNIRWGDNELSLPESKPWFTHVAWKTEGTGFNEHVVNYTIRPGYRWLWRYIGLWGQAIYDTKQLYPKAPTTLVRYINENHARFDNEGNHQGGFGGEDKIFQIVQMEYERIGLRHIRDFIMVNDWMPFKGVDFLPDVWARAGLFDRHPNHRWMREVHGVNQARRAVLEQMELKYPTLAHGKFTVRSTDGFRPEDRNYSKALNSLKRLGDEFFDGKVPSEAETHPQGSQVYYPNDFMKTFEAVKPVMKDIAK